MPRDEERLARGRVSSVRPSTILGVPSDIERKWDGWWWRPGALSSKWSGTLRFVAADGARLDAYGVQKRDPSAAPDEQPELWTPLIHGRGVDGSLLTLFDCYLWDGREYYGQRELTTSMEWRPQLVVLCGHFHKQQELVADNVALEIHGLLEWLTQPWDGPLAYVPPAPWTATHRRTPVRRRSRAARKTRRARQRRRMLNARRLHELRLDESYRQPDATEVNVGGATIRLAVDRHRSWNQLREVSELRATATFSLRSSVSFGDWEKHWFGPLRDLLILLTGQPASIEAMRFDRLDRIEEPQEPHSFEVLQQRWPGRTAQRSRGFSLIPVPRRALGRHLGRLLRDWYELHEQLVPAHAVKAG